MTVEREITCAEVVELVTAYLECALPTDDVARFEAHLVPCDGCATYVEQMRSTITATRRLRVDELPAELRDRLLAAFRGWHTEPRPGV